MLLFEDSRLWSDFLILSDMNKWISDEWSDWMISVTWVLIIPFHKPFADSNSEENGNSGRDKTGSRKTTKIEKIHPSCSFIVNEDIFLKSGFILYEDSDF